MTRKSVPASRRADGRSRQVAARVLRDLRDGVDPEQIAKESSMGLRTLRRYLARHDRCDLDFALRQAVRR